MNPTQRKPLTEMTKEELWALFPIEIKPHNPCFQTWYQQEADRIRRLLGGCIVRSSHIGSTSVPNLLAKPIVDILMEILPETDASALISLLESDGWILMSSQNEPYWNLSFNKGYTPFGFAQKVFHLHIRLPGDWDEFYFCEYLRKHSETAKKYEQLKQKLAIQFRHDRDRYTKEKTDFVRHYSALAKKEYTGQYQPPAQFLSKKF